MITQTYVVFKVSNQKYCVDILKIKEITMNKDTLIMPNTPDFVEGVTNLRGEVISVINLAKRLGIMYSVKRDEQKIIIINMNDIYIGFLVDEVIGIHHTSEEEYSKTPNLVSNDSEFVQGIIKSSQDMIISLDLEKVLSQNELFALEQMKKEQVI